MLKLACRHLLSLIKMVAVLCKSSNPLALLKLTFLNNRNRREFRSAVSKLGCQIGTDQLKCVFDSVILICKLIKNTAD